jgi:hypothetical protein
VNRFLNKVVAWVRSGYPDGVPQNDYLPILALLKRRLGTDEVAIVAKELLHRIELDYAEIGAHIMTITDALPAPYDVERVRAKLAAYGWPLDDPRDKDGEGSE